MQEQVQLLVCDRRQRDMFLSGNCIIFIQKAEISQLEISHREIFSEIQIVFIQSNGGPVLDNDLQTPPPSLSQKEPIIRFF